MRASFITVDTSTRTNFAGRSTPSPSRNIRASTPILCIHYNSHKCLLIDHLRISYPNSSENLSLVVSQDPTQTRMRPFSILRGWFASPFSQLPCLERIPLDPSNQPVSSRRLTEANRWYNYRYIDSEIEALSWRCSVVSSSTVDLSRTKVAALLGLEITDITNPIPQNMSHAMVSRHGVIPGTRSTTWETLELSYGRAGHTDTSFCRRINSLCLVAFAASPCAPTPIFHEET